MRHLTDSEIAAVREVAERLGLPAAVLAAEVDFETAGTWDPKISNPYSSAKGMLQFIDSTARGMGYQDSAALVEANPTVESQLRGPVYQYLKRFAPFRDLQSLCYAVFLPSYRHADPETKLPAHVQRVNPGIVRVRDYTDRVAARVAVCEKVFGAVG